MITANKRPSGIPVNFFFSILFNIRSPTVFRHQESRMVLFLFTSAMAEGRIVYLPKLLHKLTRVLWDNRSMNVLAVDFHASLPRCVEQHKLARLCLRRTATQNWFRR